MSERIQCACGREWSVERTPLPRICSDSAVCLCGRLLKAWDEFADYTFTPAARQHSPAHEDALTR